MLRSLNDKFRPQFHFFSYYSNSNLDPKLLHLKIIFWFFWEIQVANTRPVL